MNKNRRYEIMEAALAAMTWKDGYRSPNCNLLTWKLARFACHPEFKKLKMTLRELIEVYAHVSQHSMAVRWDALVPRNHRNRKHG